MATGGNWLIRFDSIMEILIEVFCLKLSLTHCFQTNLSCKNVLQNDGQILRYLAALRMLLKRLYKYDSLIWR